MIVRRNRLIFRLSLLIVLCMGAFGGWYSSRNWTPDFQVGDVNALTEEIDWVDVIASIGEEAVQLLLGLTSDGQ